VHDLTRLVLRRLWEGLEAGVVTVTPKDVAALVRLQRDIEKDERSAQAAGTIEQWQAATRELLWIARSHLRDDWPQFIRDVRSSEVLRSISGDPPGPGPRPQTRSRYRAACLAQPSQAWPGRAAP
jgi:hypothetical protein